MENNLRRQAGMLLARLLLISFEPIFLKEDFCNAAQIKLWFGQQIKEENINGYRNLKWKNYKIICDILLPEETYHVGIDFGQQAVHVTLGPGDVYSLYYRTPCEPE